MSSARQKSAAKIDGNAIELITNLFHAKARENFYSFRQFIHPDIATGWFQWQVALYLEQFYRDFVAGKRPKLLLMSPPQHGKTAQVQDFIAWISGYNPNIKTVFTTYSDELSVSANTNLQRILTNDQYQDIFKTRIAGDVDIEDGFKYKRNESVIEYVGYDGSFRNTTVNGQITGKGLDIGIIDDPIKGRAEASSKTIRDKTWFWLTDDFFSRFSNHAGMIMTLTRWHVDDPAGRWLLKFPETKILKYPAIATEDEAYRLKGEPLFPELKSFEFLEERRKVLSQSSWESLYQQNPIIVGGGLFPIEKLKIVSALPDLKKINKSIVYIDKAGTEGGGAFTAMVTMHKMVDETFLISDVRRGQWSALEREVEIKKTADYNATVFPNIEFWVEQEPGSGGKESAERTVRMLAGYKCYADKVTGSKELRADPLAAQVQGGNLTLLNHQFVPDLIDEMETFPNGKYKDQVDAAAGAFNKLNNPKSSYDTTMSWV